MRDGDSGVSNAQDSIIGQKLPQNLFRPSHHLRSSKRDSYSLFNTRISLCIIGLIRKWLYRHLGMRTASRRRPCWNAPCCLLADLISFLASTSSGFNSLQKYFVVIHLPNRTDTGARRWHLFAGLQARFLNLLRRLFYISFTWLVVF